MQARVFLPIHYSQVFRPVVRFDPVDMVHYLVFPQRDSEQILYHRTVFRYPFPVLDGIFVF